MGNAEVHAAAPGKDFLADRVGNRVGVVPRPLLGEGNADLHRTAGVHRVQTAKQGFAHRHHANEIIKNGAELAFGAGGIQALVVSFACRGGDIQCAVDQKLRDMQLAGATVDFRAGDLGQARHWRVGLKGGLLLGDGEYRAQVFVAGGQPLGGKSGLDVGGPALAIRCFGRHQLHDAGAGLFGGQVWQCLSALTATTRQCH